MWTISKVWFRLKKCSPKMGGFPSPLCVFSWYRGTFQRASDCSNGRGLNFAKTPQNTVSSVCPCCTHTTTAAAAAAAAEPGSVLIMTLLRSTCAITTRALFILVCMCAVWRVTSVKEDLLYWFLLLLLLPLVLEMIFTLKRRRGEDYKWCDPALSGSLWWINEWCHLWMSDVIKS